MTDSTELAPRNGTRLSMARLEEGSALIRSGADVVYIAEDLYFRLFRLVLVLLAPASAWSVWARLADAQRGNLTLTVVYAGCGVLLSIAGLALGWRAYAWLRRTRFRQLTPAILGAMMMLTDGPHSAAWWMAFALLLVMATVSSTSMTLIGAVLAAGAYIGGTLVMGSPLIYQGDTGNLIGAAMLVVNALVARSVGEAFGGFVMRMHRLQAQIHRIGQTPRRVPNLAPSLPSPASPAARTNRVRTPVRWRSVLTARQLEVAFLVRDGLKQDEIAACLEISRRQVERLLEQARTRSGAASTSELIAMLVRDQLVPRAGGLRADAPRAHDEEPPGSATASALD